jgi:hypothetical protein
LHQGRNLAAKDKNGTSDPVGFAAHRSQVMTLTDFNST